MSARQLKDGSIRFRGIANQAQYECVVDTAEEAGCVATMANNMTVITISGTAKQMKAFENLYFN